MLLATGVLMSVFQLVFFPPFIKVVGIAAFQRLGFLISIPAFLAVLAVKMLISWNYPSLFAASVVANTLALCSLWAVSEATHFAMTTALFMSSSLLLGVLILVSSRGGECHTNHHVG